MSIDTPEFWALLNARDEGAMDDAHAVELEQAIVGYIDALMERDRKDAERWRTFEKALRTNYFQGAAHGRRFKIVEICPMYGDETEFNDFIGAIDAELAKNKKEIDAG